MTQERKCDGAMSWFNSRSARAQGVWLSLSLTIAAMYSGVYLHQAFSAPYVVQDDARQSLVWMWRLIDPDLFRGHPTPTGSTSLIVDYFQSVAPFGYASLYRGFAVLGIDPLLLSKLLPPILALGTTIGCFTLSMQMVPLPLMAFVATLLFNQNLWMRDDLPSASPRAFLNLFFLAFLVALLRGSLLGCAVTIALLGLFYPQYVFIAAGMLLVRLLQSPRQTVSLCLVGLAVAVLVMLPFALSASEFGPTITAAAARSLPEFSPTGRARFFFDDFGRYWLSGGRSGLQVPFDPPLIGLGVLLPVLYRFPDRFPLLQRVKHLSMLVHLTLVSLVMFGLAHAMLFKLHLPSRYTQHSLRIVMALAAAIVLTALIDALHHQGQRWFAIVIVALLLVGYPFTLTNFPRTSYVIGKMPALYEFIAQQPKTAVIASLAEEANNLPVFARRSVLVGSEYAIPYHLGYYRRFRQRVLDLITAEYSPNLQRMQTTIANYGITLWIVDRANFTPEALAQNSWLRQYQPAYGEALRQLQQNQVPAIVRHIPRCSVMETGSLVVLNAACLVDSKE